MSKILCSLISIAIIPFVIGAAFAASREQPQSELVRIQTGTYKIFQRIGQDTVPREIGSETFTKKYFTNNTIVVEGELELNYGVMNIPTNVIKGSTNLEIEEESGFPRRYSTKKDVGGIIQALTVEMFANIAVITQHKDDEEVKSTHTLVTGTMFVEGNLIHQQALLLNRFSFDLPGKQNIMVFDPFQKREFPTTIEYVGEETAVIEGISKMLKVYTLAMAKRPEMKLYVDDSGTVVKAGNGVQEFVLADYKQEK